MSGNNGFKKSSWEKSVILLAIKAIVDSPELKILLTCPNLSPKEKEIAEGYLEFIRQSERVLAGQNPTFIGPKIELNLFLAREEIK